MQLHTDLNNVGDTQTLCSQARHLLPETKFHEKFQFHRTPLTNTTGIVIFIYSCLFCNLHTITYEAFL